MTIGGGFALQAFVFVIGAAVIGLMHFDKRLRGTAFWLFVGLLASAGISLLMGIWAWVGGI